MKAFFYGVALAAFVASAINAAVQKDEPPKVERVQCVTDSECALLESPFAVATAAQLIRERRAEIERRLGE